MIQNLLSMLRIRGHEPKAQLFTAEQLLETFQCGYRAGQADGPAKPVVPRPLDDIVSEYLAELDALAVVVTDGGGAHE